MEKLRCEKKQMRACCCRSRDGEDDEVMKMKETAHEDEDGSCTFPVPKTEQNKGDNGAGKRKDEEGDDEWLEVECKKCAT